MAPHLSAADRDFLVRMTGAKKSPVEIHTHLVARKMRQGLPAPALNNLRKALKGLTYKQGMKETRGRKRIVECKKGMMDTRVRTWRTHTNPSLHFVRQRRKLSVTNAKAMNKVRKRLIAEAGGQQEVHWTDIIRAARIPKVHHSTASRALKAFEPDLRWRAPREKPNLDKGHMKERVSVCKEWASLPSSYWTKKVDLIIDNKKFAIPSNTNARAHLRMSKVRGHLRTPGEGHTMSNVAASALQRPPINTIC
jgi:hypothetical protein